MKILIATGSSGGHIFPALALAQELGLRDKQPEVLLLLPRRSLGKVVVAAQCAVEYTGNPKLILKFNREFVFSLIGLIGGFWQSLRILVKFKPDVVVGFGSLDSVAAIFFAWLLRIKTVIHEQNVMPGRANRLLAKIADKVAISFPQSSGDLAVSSGKIVLTGNPLRRELIRIEPKAAADFFNFDYRKFTILVCGGSQSSARINTEFIKALSLMDNRQALQVIHLCGRQDYDFLKERYQALGVEARLYDFFQRMHYAYSASSLAVCRCGATTVSELILFNLPAVLVPYPYAYMHQAANAGILQGAGSAIIIQDRELKPDILKEEIIKLMNHPERLAAMRLAFNRFGVIDAKKELARLVQALI